MTAPDRPFVALAVVALLQGVALLGYAVFDVVEAVRVGITGPEEVSNPAALILLIVITAAFGVGLVWVGVGLVARPAVGAGALHPRPGDRRS